MNNLSLNTNEINVIDLKRMGELEEILLDNGEDSDEWFGAKEELLDMLDSIEDATAPIADKSLNYEEQRAILSLAKTGLLFTAKPEN